MNSKMVRALNKKMPIKELISLAEEKFFLGKSKSEILHDFDGLCEYLGDDDKIDTVLEAMDIIDGWCSPSKDIIINKSDVSEKDYVNALNNIKDSIDSRKRKMLKAHYQYKKLTHSDLARHAGISSPKIVNIEYGEIGHLICKELHFPSIIEKKKFTPVWRSVFAKKRR